MNSIYFTIRFYYLSNTPLISKNKVQIKYKNHIDTLSQTTKVCLEKGGLN